jgi:hypothetical protein
MSEKFVRMTALKLDTESAEIADTLRANGITFASFVRRLLKTTGKKWMIKHGYYKMRSKTITVAEPVHEPMVEAEKVEAVT